MERKPIDGKQRPYVTRDGMIVLPKKPADHPLGYQDEDGNIHRVEDRYLRMTKNMKLQTV